jgi:hypothetical protein
MNEDVKLLISRIYADAAMHNIKAWHIAERSGIGKNVLSLWRNEKASPTLENYVKVRRALDDLINEKA